MNIEQKITAILESKKKIIAEAGQSDTIITYAGLQYAAQLAELRAEHEKLSTLLTNPQLSLDEKREQFKTLFQDRERCNQGTSFSSAATPTGHCNDMYWELAKLLFSHAYLHEQIAIFLPGVTHSYELEELYDDTMDGKIQFTVKKIPINQSRIKVGSSAQLAESIILDGGIFNVRQIAYFDFKRHQLFRDYLNAEHPGLSYALYRWNHHFKLLDNELRLVEKKVETPREVIDGVISELSHHQDREALVEFSEDRAVVALANLSEYLCLLPQGLRQSLEKMQGNSFTLERILKMIDKYEKIGTNAKCVIAISTNLSGLLRNPENNSLLDMALPLSSARMASMVEKYRYTDPTEGMNVRASQTITKVMPTRWVDELLGRVDFIPSRQSDVFVSNISLDEYPKFFSGLTRYPNPKLMHALVMRANTFPEERKVSFVNAMMQSPAEFGEMKNVIYIAILIDQIDVARVQSLTVDDQIHLANRMVAEDYIWVIPKYVAAMTETVRNELVATLMDANPVAVRCILGLSGYGFEYDTPSNIRQAIKKRFCDLSTAKKLELLVSIFDSGYGHRGELGRTAAASLSYPLKKAEVEKLIELAVNSLSSLTFRSVFYMTFNIRDDREILLNHFKALSEEKQREIILQPYRSGSAQSILMAERQSWFDFSKTIMAVVSPRLLTELFIHYSRNGINENSKIDGILAVCSLFPAATIKDSLPELLARLSTDSHFELVEHLVYTSLISYDDVRRFYRLKDAYGNSALHRAASGMNIPLIKFIRRVLLSDYGLELTTANVRGQTPLCIAVAVRHKSMVEQLLPDYSPKKLKRVFERNKDLLVGLVSLYDTDLVMDCLVGLKNEDIARLITASNLGSEGYTILQHAAFNSTRMADFLLSCYESDSELKGAICRKGEHGNNMLHSGIGMATTILRHVAKADRASVLSMKDRIGNTPLHLMAKSGNTEAMKAVLRMVSRAEAEMLMKITNHQHQSPLACLEQAKRRSIDVTTLYPGMFDSVVTLFSSCCGSRKTRVMLVAEPANALRR